MKKLLMAIAVLFTTATLYTAQAQDAADTPRLSEMLQSYYNIKDALVAGNNKTASESAAAFIKNLNGISDNPVSKSDVKMLLKDAGAIADAKSIDKQRAAFSNFSSNMTTVAKTLKLSDKPVYIQYCPMKKSSWLSSEQAIKNPYYGSSMLTCGKVTDTIQ